MEGRVENKRPKLRTDVEAKKEVGVKNGMLTHTKLYINAFSEPVKTNSHSIIDPG